MSRVLSLVEELDSMTSGFMKVWTEWLKEDEEFGDGEQPNEHNVFLKYNHFIVHKLDELSSEDKKVLFGYIENTLNSNDNNLSEAVATCFLESLVQQSGQYKAENYFPFLGPKSIAYSRAWDDYNGMKTKGLW